MEAIASRLDTIARRLEVNAIIATRMEAIASKLEAIAMSAGVISCRMVQHVGRRRVERPAWRLGSGQAIWDAVRVFRTDTNCLGHGVFLIL